MKARDSEGGFLGKADEGELILKKDKSDEDKLKV